MENHIIDSHAHCGKNQLFEEYIECKSENIRGAVMFPPVAEIYDRYDIKFQDNEEWQIKRRKANEYVLLLENKDFKVYPFFFVWNDFPNEQLKKYRGVKWHRHEDEPEYNYDSERCKKFIQEIEKRNLPVILEEEVKNTILFINDFAPKIKVIIPHLGMLNGGYERIEKLGFWEKERVYTDTSLVLPEIIEDYIKKYGYERIMFGSDFPFGNPKTELEKILRLNIPEKAKEKITCLNILSMLRLLVKT